MRSEERAAARRGLEKRLSPLRDSSALMRPPRGWLKAIREAIGMTTGQLAKRLGVVQSRVIAIEKAEVDGSITLKSLEKAARALDCRVVYAIVPRKPLEEMVTEQATRLAKRRLASTRHSMALEAQGVEPADERQQLRRMVQRLVDQAGSKLWEEEQ